MSPKNVVYITNILMKLKTDSTGYPYCVQTPNMRVVKSIIITLMNESDRI